MPAITRPHLVRVVRPLGRMGRSAIRASFFLTTLVAAALSAQTAEAKGTFFLLELNSGVSESAYSGGDPGFSYGASAGLTFRIPSTPFRYHLLGSVLNRTVSHLGQAPEGLVSTERRDLDLFTAHRLVLPVWRMVRVYAELGLGTRFTRARVQRAAGLGDLVEDRRGFLLLTALGVQARVTETFSVGLRGELAPAGGGADLATYVANARTTQNRLGLTAQLGVHF